MENEASFQKRIAESKCIFYPKYSINNGLTIISHEKKLYLKCVFMTARCQKYAQGVKIFRCQK